MSWSVSCAILAIAVMLALDSVAARSDQIPLTCHSCVKSTTSWNSTNTCPESFQATGATTCRGKACLMTLSEHESDGSTLSVGCPTGELDRLLGTLQAALGGQGSLGVSSCNLLNQYRLGRTFYLYDGMCCTTEKKQLNPTIAYNETICGCDSNYCNRNLTSFQLNSGPTTESKVIQTTASKVIQTTTSQVIQTTESQVIQTTESQVIQTTTSQVIQTGASSHGSSIQHGLVASLVSLAAAIFLWRSSQPNKIWTTA